MDNLVFVIKDAGKLVHYAADEILSVNAELESVTVNLKERTFKHSVSLYREILGYMTRREFNKLVK